MSSSHLRPVRLAVGVAITLTCLWLSLRKVRLDGLHEALREVHWIWLAIAFAALLAGYVVRIYRWRWMLAVYNPAVTFRSCVGPLIAGFAINNIIPFRAGDALRVWGFRKQLDLPAALLLGSLVVERILDLTVLLGFLFLGTVGLKGAISAAYLHTAIALVVMATLGWTLLVFTSKQLKRLILGVCHTKSLAVNSLSPQLEQHVDRFFIALDVIRTPVRAIKLLGMSGLVWTCEGGIFAAVARGAHYEGQPYGPWFALGTASLSTLLPSSPGYVGTFEFFAMSGLTAYGGSATMAAVIAFMIHGILWLPSTLTGLTYLRFAYPKGRKTSLIANSISEDGHA